MFVKYLTQGLVFPPTCLSRDQGRGEGGTEPCERPVRWGQVPAGGTHDKEIREKS